MTIDSNTTHHAFEVELAARDLDPETVRVELYADGVAVPLESARILWQR